MPTYRLYSILALCLAVALLPASVQAQPEILTPTPSGPDIQVYDNGVYIYRGVVFQQGDPVNGGTGNLQPFLRIAGNTPIIHGVNTANSKEQFDAPSTWTRGLLLSTITQRIVDVNGTETLFREFVLDINQSANRPWYPLNDLQIYENQGNVDDMNCLDPLDYGETVDQRWDETGTWCGGTPYVTGTATLEFWLDAEENATAYLDYDYEAGSGEPDLVLLVPDDYFDQDPACAYGQSGCETFVYVYAMFGDLADAPLCVSGGPGFCEGNTANFEEWATFVYPFVQVSKTADAAVDKTYTWDIDKVVVPEHCDALAGDDCSFEYEVTIDQTVTFGVPTLTGTITIVNPREFEYSGASTSAAVVDYLTDLFPGATTVNITGCDLPFTVNSGQTRICGYSAVFPPGWEPVDGTNTATVGLEEISAFFVATAPVEFDINEIGYDYVEVTDDLEGLLGNVSGDDSFTYPFLYECSSDPGAYTDGHYQYTRHNTATIVETGQNDDANLTVDCWAPVVSKTAVATYDRTHRWTIDKVATPVEHVLFMGETGHSDYDVSVDKTTVEDNFLVTGEISIHNPSPLVMDLTVSDELDTGLPANLDCGPSVSINPGGTQDCEYNAVPPNALPSENTVEAELTTGATFSDTVPFTFTVNMIGFDEIDVDDTILGPGIFHASDDYLYEYTRDFPCSTVLANYTAGHYSYTVDNTATINQTGQQDDASVTVHCYAPVVDKTAEATFARSYSWTIDKTATPTPIDMFVGDDHDVDYTVTVDKTTIDASFLVTGQILVANPHPTRTMTVSVADVLNDGTVAELTCEGTLEVPAAAAASCFYTAEPTDATATLNTATVGFAGVDFIATAPFTFSNEEIGFSEIHVVDSIEGLLGIVSDDATFSYSKNFECEAIGQSTYGNVASITETGQSDNANVVVNCYDITMAKTADTEYFRRYDWLVDKRDTDPNTDDAAPELLLDIGQTYNIPYEVSVDVAGVEDYGHRAFGQILIGNPGPIPAPIVGLTDMISGAGVDIECGGFVPPALIPPGGTVTCTYDVPVDPEDDLNSATAVLQNHHFTAAGVATPTQTQLRGATAAIEFGDPEDLIDECTNVYDDHGSGPVLLGEACYDETLPKHFNYTFPVTPTEEDCDGFWVNNLASQVERDSGRMTSDEWAIWIMVNCPEGCTLTQGYWKTHSDQGPAPYDEAWGNILDFDWDTVAEEESESLFGAGTWFDVFWTAPKGNAWYNLAHQWMAAYLNWKNGASTPDEVTTALEDGIGLLAMGPDAFIAPKGNAKSTPAGIATLALIDQARTAASILASYNEGYIGPGHCDEDHLSVLSSVGVQDGVEIDAGSLAEVIAPEEVIEIPTEFSVSSYPNPFNPTTTIQVALPEASHVRVAVYDVLGRMVTLLVNEDMQAGTHRVTFDAGMLPSGVYLYRLDYAGGTVTKTMQLLK